MGLFRKIHGRSKINLIKKHSNNILTKFMEGNKEKLIVCAEAIIQAYNSQNMLEMEKSCVIMDGFMKRQPTYFITTKHPYIVSIALFYAIREGFCQNDNAIVVTYYSLIKTIRKSSSPHDMLGASMLAFIFLDEHKAVIGLNVIGNNLPQSHGTNRDDIIIHQIIGQLSVFYWSFNEPGNERISFDNLTLELLENTISKFRHKVDGVDTGTRNRVTDFIMGNFDVILQTLEIYWEDLEEDDFY